MLAGARLRRRSEPPVGAIAHKRSAADHYYPVPSGATGTGEGFMDGEWFGRTDAKPMNSRPRGPPSYLTYRRSASFYEPPPRISGGFPPASASEAERTNKCP